MSFSLKLRKVLNEDYSITRDYKSFQIHFYFKLNGSREEATIYYFYPWSNALIIDDWQFINRKTLLFII